MKSVLAAFAAGLLFAVGLAISGMTQPTKVVGFLDVTGNWDPSLAMVMAGALAVYVVAFPLIRRRNAPLLSTAFDVPTRRDFTVPLVGGAVLFGLGWGVAGFCPGPAVAALGAGMSESYLFVGTMLVGMGIAGRIRPTAGSAQAASMASNEPGDPEC